VLARVTAAASELRILANSGPGSVAARVTGAGSFAVVVGTDSLPELHDAASMMNSPAATSRFAMAPFIRVSGPAGAGVDPQ
jgi:hypothetical protein